MSSDKDLRDLTRQLNIIVRLLAYQIVSTKNVTQGAPILKRLGLSLSEIADIYASTPNSISVRLSEARRSKSRSK